MKCEDAEILICDYATLASAERFELERHMETCPACAELARDSAAAIAFMERVADIEPPPELITRILFDAPWTKAHSKSKTRLWIRGLLSPILQPKFAMGMAMTILSLSMLAKFVTPVRQLKAEDLRPAQVWAGLEDRASRTWARTVKFYENLKFVYQVQTTLREWQQQDEERRAPAQPNPGGQTDDRKIPVKSPPPASPTGSAQ
jgi:hypothetical protein